MPQHHPIRILHITRSEIVGIRVFLAGLLAHMDRDRFHVKVASPLKGALTQDLKRLDVPALPCSMERDIKLRADLKSLIRICTLLRTDRPDILHLHGAKAGFLGRIAAWLYGIPAVYTPNNDYLDEPMSRTRRGLLVALEKFTARLGAKIVSVSHEERSSWLGRRICRPDDIVTIRDGFDWAQASVLMSSGEAKRGLGIPEECPVAGLIARLVPQKAPHIFLQAAAKVLQRNPKAYFLVVGDGPLASSLQNLASALAIQRRVRFLGYQENLSPIYSAMDVSVLTSLYEGLSMVVLESMYLQIPVVTSRTYGAREVVTTDCGIVTPILDANATADAILEVLSDPQKAQQMGSAGRARALAEFGADRMAAQYQSLYLEMLRQPQADSVSLLAEKPAASGNVSPRL